ncbi:MAG TPA: hypothetical protein VGH66_03880 [Acidimicrobiales bacterium]
MSRRIDIELTSARPDGTWTWRAAGALKPRGVLDGTLLYQGAKTGDVVRADAEFEIEGITIAAVLPPKDKKRAEPERIDVIGPPRDNVPGVTSSLVGRSDSRRSDSGPRGQRHGPDGGPRRTDGAGRGRPSGDRGPRTGPSSADRPGRTPDGGPHERPARPAPDGAAQARPARPAEGKERPPRPPREAGGSDAARRGAPRPAPAEAAERSRARRLSPGNTHRTAVLDSLPPEQRPIAEQVLRGGIPAVRTAIHLEREKATAEGRTAPNADALLAIAEELLPKLRAAEWRDRAEAAAKIADEISLRDLRSVVTGADVARDDEGRQLAASLREALERRVEALRQEWVGEVTQNLEEGRVVRALRLAARPPEPAARVPAELATQLAEAAGRAMAPDTPPERWAALLEAVAASPVRRSVKPAGLPADAPEDLLQAARQSSGRIPALAPMLGIAMPPPPGPLRPAGRPRHGQPPGRRGEPAKPSGAGPRPAATPAHGIPPATTGVEAAPTADATEPAADPAPTTPVADGPPPIEAATTGVEATPPPAATDATPTADAPAATEPDPPLDPTRRADAAEPSAAP